MVHSVLYYVPVLCPGPGGLRVKAALLPLGEEPEPRWREKGSQPDRQTDGAHSPEGREHLLSSSADVFGSDGQDGLTDGQAAF